MSTEQDKAVALAEKHGGMCWPTPDAISIRCKALPAMLAERDKQHTEELAQQSGVMPPKPKTITMLSDLQSGTMQVMHEDVAEQWVREALATMQARVEQVERNSARMRSAIFEMHSDWKKGDFDLPVLAQHDLAACYDAALKGASNEAADQG